MFTDACLRGTHTSSAFYVQDPRQHEEEALRTIEAALAHGVNMLDTAWIYQNQTPDGLTHFNETLVGRAARQLGREKFGKSNHAPLQCVHFR